MTRGRIIKKLDKVFSLWVRHRFAKNGIAECVTCGKKDKISKMQAGHFISRKHYSTRWNPTNVQVQCPGCNVFKYGEQYKFGLYLDRVYGVGTAEELLSKSKQIIKLTNEELLEKIKLYENY